METLNLVARSTGDVLGGLTERWATVVHCINSGFEFEAEIVKDAPTLRVAIRPRTAYDVPATFEAVLADTPVTITFTDGQALTLHNTGDQVLARDTTGHMVGVLHAHPVELPRTLTRRTFTVTVVDAHAGRVRVTH